jgi:hypothetical protein
MFSIEPARHDLPINVCHEKTEKKGKRKYGGDKELGSVSVGTGIRHGEKTGLGVFQFEVFICEFFTVDRFSTGTAKQLDFSFK